MNQHVRYIILPLLIIALLGCHNISPEKLYPTSITSPVYKVGQKYVSKVDLYNEHSVLSKWHNFYENDSSHLKVKSGTVFEILKIEKNFSGSFGRYLNLWVEFNIDSKKYTSTLSGEAISKKILNIEGYEVYLVPDPTKAYLIK